MFLRVSITDNGIGMTKEMIEKIFDPYFSTRIDDGGSGLGLPVSLGIVQSYRGAIEVRSEPGRGSCFNVYLPEYNGEKSDE